MGKKKKKENPWKDWEAYEEANMIKAVLQDITDLGYDEAIAKHKIEPWFEPKILEHIERVRDGVDVQEI